MKTKNLKVLAMILLTSTLLILASTVSVPVKAATTTTLFLYTTLGLSSVTANGAAMTIGGNNNFNSGDTVQFQATASSGWQFLCFVYADASGTVASTDNPYSKVVTATCALEAVFIPTTNTTATASGSGTATLTIFATIGGETSPAGSTTGASATGTIGHSTTLTQTPGTDFKFLCWITQCSSSNYYTSSPLEYTPTAAGAALEAIWIPTSSSITLPSTSPTPTPSVDEVSSAIITVLALALVACAFGTYTYAKKNRK